MAAAALKIMRHTLYAYWIGQSISWIVFTLAAWAVWSKSVTVTVLAYAASWVFATAVAWFFWHKESGRFRPALPAEPGEAKALIRYGAPRAPAALLSQALFYTDLFVLSILLPKGDPELSVYAACVRVSQALVLFLTAASYMFSPFVADLHERGEHDRLNGLFKSVTRWTLGGTVPLLLLFLIAPAQVLHVFGSEYDAGTAWLRILLIGQTVNVSVGAAGFVLIMVGRTGWDLTVYASSFVLDLVIALLLIPHLGPTGAAIAQSTTLVFSNAFRALPGLAVRAHPAVRPGLRADPDPDGARRGGHARRPRDARGAQVGVGPVGHRVDRRVGLLHRVPAGRPDPKREGLRHADAEPGPGDLSFDVRPLDDTDRPWVRAFIRERWGDEIVVGHGVVYRPHLLAGLVAIDPREPVGLLTYTIDGDSCEIVTIDAMVERRGVGSLLIAAVEDAARDAGCTRLWLITTNDNEGALGFYRTNGFELVAVHEGAVARSRELKPSIPLVNEAGVPIQDEIEMERRLPPGPGQ